MPHIRLTVDAHPHDIQVDDPQMPLLYALRDDLGLHNPRFGCGLSQCGACTVLVDGQQKRSCRTTVAEADGHEITTLAGLGTPEQPHPLQTAFAEEEAMQCGYCLNGWIMYGAALLKRNPHPTREQIAEGTRGLICRCGAHTAMMRAIERASKAGVA